MWPWRKMLAKGVVGSGSLLPLYQPHENGCLVDGTLSVPSACVPMPLIILVSHGALPLLTKCTFSLDWFTYSLGIVAMDIQSGQSFLPYLHMTRSQFSSEQTNAAHLA